MKRCFLHKKLNIKENKKKGKKHQNIKMNLDYDIKERVSKLESMGRKICTDLRNLQKERIILSREAKCLLTKFEKGEALQNRYKTTNSEDKPCSCAVWENDLRKDDEDNVEDSTKSSIMQNEEFCTCTNFCDECCQHSVPRHDCNTVCKYLISRCNKYDESFDFDHLIKDIDNSYIDDNVTIEDEVDDNHFNNVNELFRYCESSHLCNLCMLNEDNDTEDTVVLSTIDPKLHFNRSTKTNTKELIERERGGGGKSESESITIENVSNQSICTCGCDLCVLRNKHGNRPPCYKKHEEEIYSFFDIDQEDDLLLNNTTCLELPEISQYCRIGKLREALEKLKNRNHILRKLLKNRKCILMDPMRQETNCTFSSSYFKQYDINNNENIIQKHEEVKSNKITNDLVAMLKILQRKCRIKDGMIVTLADEFKRCAESERIQRTLQKLAELDLDCQIIDFDRSTLWKYLISEIEYFYPDKQKNIIHKKGHRNKFTICSLILILIFLFNNKIQLWRIQCVAILFLRTTNNICYRIYELIRNLVCNNIIVFIIKCCIYLWNIFLPSIDCCTLRISSINFAYDIVLFINNYFPWSIDILIYEIIMILFVWYLIHIYRVCNIATIF